MEDLIIPVSLGAYLVLVVLDTVAPARRFPAVRWWRLKGFTMFVVNNAVAIATPLVVADLLPSGPLLDASALGVVAGSIVGLVVLQLGAYLWHRTLHRVDALWRIHQLHHSAERIDVWGVFYTHPLDIVGFTIVPGLFLGVLVGVGPEATATAALVTSLLTLQQHANLRTPAWLGYLFQRPENHAVHHQRGVHGMNYGDISLWDIVFGTFRNPRTWDAEAGFYDGASSRLGEMLIGRDVTRPPAATAPGRELPLRDAA